jgi:serine/threonine protein kinase
VARRYCSRCLQTFAAREDPDRCKRSTCQRSRPEAGWPEFLGLGDTIDGRYAVEEILGAGGAGITYRCREHRSRESVAVKVLHGDRRHGVLATRLAIEGEVLELLDHPHIVPFRALSLVGDGEAYLVTRHMEGGSLDAWLRRHGTVPPKAAVRLGRQLALALDYVHAGGIVHRDLKPANVLLQDDDPHTLHARLADFGIARIFRETRPMPELTRTGAFIGTPEYAAPEQKRGEKGVGPAADAFALGALLHAAASGQPLHRREDLEDWEEFRFRTWNPEERPRLTALVPARGRDLAALNLLDEVIDALMQPDAAARIDMGHAALRLGAHPEALAPRDLPAFSPPSLVSGAEGLGDIDALLPAELAPEPPTVERATILLPREASPAREPSPAREREPRFDLPVPVAITRDAASDWDDEDVDWDRRQRRDRRHGRLAVAASLLLGAALAWPGGPGALLEQSRLAGLAPPLQDLAARLRLDEPTVAAEPPPRGRVVGARTADSDAASPSILAASSSLLGRPATPTRAAGTKMAKAPPRPAEAKADDAAPSTGAERSSTAPARSAPAAGRTTATASRSATPGGREAAGGPAATVRRHAAGPTSAIDRRAAGASTPLADLLSLAHGGGEPAGAHPGRSGAIDGEATYVEPLRRQREEADRRAVAYEAEARDEQERRQALLARIERIGAPAERAPALASNEGDEAPALDPEFLRAPRLRPRPDGTAPR